ncbi:MAG: signal recognition particle-docking protein FtsY [Thermoprotei archaeon]
MFEGIKKTFKKFVDAVSTKTITEEELESYLWELQIELASNNVALAVAEEITENIKKQLIGTKIQRFSNIENSIYNTAKIAILNIFNQAGSYNLIESIKKEYSHETPFTILFVGVNGSGKTTTIAKIAHLLKKHGYKSVIACADTFRAGAIEQMERHALAVGAMVIKHKYGSSPAAVAYDAVEYAKAHFIPVVLIDTAGRMQTDKDLLEEMKKIHRVIKPNATIFVGDALAGNDALDQALKFNSYTPLTGSILTKIDADEKGGTTVSIVYATKKPLLYLGIGQKYDDLIDFKPEWLIERFFK